MTTEVRESIWEQQIPLSAGLALGLLGFLLGYAVGGMGTPVDPFVAERPDEARLANLLVWGPVLAIGFACREPVRDLLAVPQRPLLMLTVLAFVPVTIADLLSSQLAIAISGDMRCAPGTPPLPSVLSFLPRAAILGTTVLLALLAWGRHLENLARGGSDDMVLTPLPEAYSAMSGEWLHLPEAPLLRVRIQDVTLIRSAGNYSEIVANGRVHLVRATLSELAHRFAPLGFVRVHRQTVVNARQIREIRREPGGRPIVHLACGMPIPLGRRFRSAIEALG